MKDLFLFLLTLVGLNIVLWTAYGIIARKKESEINKHPIKKQKAKLVDMQRIAAGEIVLGEIWVLFETQDGRRLRLNANSKNQLVVGDVGMLTWQGTKIHKFERTLSDETVLSQRND